MTANIRVIDHDSNERTISWEAGQSLMEALRDNDLPVLASCGGCCSCATCHVLLEQNFASIVGTSEGEERELLEQTEAFSPDVSRLACQIPYSEAYDGFTIRLAPEA